MGWVRPTRESESGLLLPVYTSSRRNAPVSILTCRSDRYRSFPIQDDEEAKGSERSRRRCRCAAGPLVSLSLLPAALRVCPLRWMGKPCPMPRPLPLLLQPLMPTPVVRACKWMGGGGKDSCMRGMSWVWAGARCLLLRSVFRPPSGLLPHDRLSERLLFSKPPRPLYKLTVWHRAADKGRGRGSRVGRIASCARAALFLGKYSFLPLIVSCSCPSCDRRCVKAALLEPPLSLTEQSVCVTM